MDGSLNSMILWKLSETLEIIRNSGKYLFWQFGNKIENEI